MPLFEDRSASFIVRVWCESGDARSRTVRAWRGSVEHVPSGQRAFFQELDAVIAFMKPHLAALGIEDTNRFWERMEERAAAALAELEAAAPAAPVVPPPRTKAPRRGR